MQLAKMHVSRSLFRTLTLLYGCFSHFSASSPTNPSVSELPANTSISLEQLNLGSNTSMARSNPSIKANMPEIPACYMPISGVQPVSPQAALIALARLAYLSDFDSERIWRNFALLVSLRSTAILVLKTRSGQDSFSYLDVANRAMDVIKYCVIEQPPELQLGGELSIGTQNNFRVVVKGLAPRENLPQES